MVGGPRLRPFAAVALALALTACSSGPGGGGAVRREARSTTTTVTGGLDVHDDVVVEGVQVGGTPAPGSTSTTAGGRMAARTGGGRDLPPPSGSSSTTTTTATTTTTTLPPGLPAESCPQPKTCRYYTFLTADPYRWPIGPDGRATIEYWLNPAGAAPLSPVKVEGAVAAAFATWERAAPTLRFVYKGRTDRLGIPHDGVNVVAFDGDHSYAFVTTGEFDIHFNSGNWAWQPCEPRDGACTPEKDSTAEVGSTKVIPSELQSVATHEVGHVLWLGHPPGDPAYAELTMNPALRRSSQTLALGDVLGIRALYPCSCPLPPIYDP